MNWPFKLSKISMNIVFNGEIQGSELAQTYVEYMLHQKYAPYNGNLMPVINVTYHKYEPDVYNTGYDRQQYVMFTIDYYNSAEYISNLWTLMPRFTLSGQRRHLHQ